MAEAHARGVAVVMGPVGGYDEGAAAELALRFVLANPSVDVAISGMSTREQVEANCASVDAGPLSASEVELVNRLVAENKALADLYCTGCGYCLPCPQGRMS
ncbi:MAG: hypothetical protein GXY52_11425 [Chloroflexi bacterium]|nr:hypothetical protein [Chloroflexota bacterium]